MRLKTVIAVLLGLGVVLTVLGSVAVPNEQLPSRTGPSIASAKSWGYQLQRIHPALVPSGIDVMVVDYARHGDEPSVLTASDIATLRRRSDGTQRIVLAYLSIGEAESYRYYWQSHWRFRPPSWLIRENSDWKANYVIRYWDPGWQQILFDEHTTLVDRFLGRFLTSRRSYVDRIIEAGFDGVYLDRVDAFDEAGKERPSAEADMVALVSALSAYAKRRRPGFLVVPQNGEELLQHESYRKAIDGAAKEDLVFGLDGADIENTDDNIEHSIALLNQVKADGKSVFVVEYVRAPEKRIAIQKRLQQTGFVLHFAARLLNLPPEAPPRPLASPPSPEPRAPGRAAPQR